MKIAQKWIVRAHTLKHTLPAIAFFQIFHIDRFNWIRGPLPVLVSHVIFLLKILDFVAYFDLAQTHTHCAFVRSYIYIYILNRYTIQYNEWVTVKCIAMYAVFISFFQIWCFFSIHSGYWYTKLKLSQAQSPLRWMGDR